MRLEAGAPAPRVSCVRALAMGLVAALAACATHPAAELSAPQTGCAASELEVSHFHGARNGDGPQSWMAQCGDRRWFCSQLHQRTLCDEIPAGTPWPPPEAPPAEG